MLSLTFLEHIKAECVQTYGSFEAALRELGYTQEAFEYDACKKFERFKSTSEEETPLLVQIMAATATPATSGAIHRAEFVVTRSDEDALLRLS